MKKLEEILCNRDDISDSALARAKSEIKYLKQAKLDEAFACLVEVLDELKKLDIYYRLDGAINISTLAHCAGIVNVEVAEKDYFFSRFVNPYSDSIIGIQFLSACVSIEPNKIQEAMKISREVCEECQMQDTLYLLKEEMRKDLDSLYKLAKQEGKSLLEITFCPSVEIGRFLRISDDVKSIKPISDEELFKYIRTKPIAIFDDGEKYLRIMQDVNPKDIDDVALALTLLDFNREDELEHIKDFRQYGHSSHAEAVTKILADSYDTLVYQEQAMSIFCLLSGCSKFHADNLRRNLGKRSISEKAFVKEILCGGADVIGRRFCGCNSNDLIVDEVIDVESCLNEVYKSMPKLYIKAHALARAKFFLDSAILQMCKEMEAPDKRRYVVCDFTIVGGQFNKIYYNGENVGRIEPTIIEIASVKVVGGKIVDKYNTYVGIADYDPQFLDFDLAPEFRGITPMRLLGAPSLETALRELSQFVKDCALILRNDSFPYETAEILKKCGESFGIEFNNPILMIDNVLQTAEVLRECFRIGSSDVMQIASKMRGACDWKSIFEEYRVDFERDDCLGYALAFAELIIQLDMTLDVWT